MHFNISQGPLFTEIYRKNAAPQNHGADFVRACAVETRVKISQEPLYTEIHRKNAAAQSEHPDQAPAFTPTVRTQAAWTHCLGKNCCGTSGNGMNSGMEIPPRDDLALTDLISIKPSSIY